MTDRITPASKQQDVEQLGRIVWLVREEAMRLGYRLPLAMTLQVASIVVGHLGDRLGPPDIIASTRYQLQIRAGLSVWRLKGGGGNVIRGPWARRGDALCQCGKCRRLLEAKEGER